MLSEKLLINEEKSLSALSFTARFYAASDKSAVGTPLPGRYVLVALSALSPISVLQLDKTTLCLPRIEKLSLDGVNVPSKDTSAQ